MHKLNIPKLFKKPLLFSLALMLLIGVLTGCTPNPENFSTTKITITLDESFKKYDLEGYDLSVKSDDVVFTAKEETFHNLERSGYELNSLADYADEILSLNGTKGDKLAQRDNYYYFTTTKTDKGAKYTYVHCMYEDKEAYWVCIFYCKSKDYNRLSDDIFKWADSVEITN